MRSLVNYLVVAALLFSAALVVPSCEKGADGEPGEKGDRGERGEQGLPGVAGSVVTVGADGYWYINDVKTDHRALPINGVDGVDGEDGQDGEDGAPGTPGTVVTIVDGYWAFNGVPDTDFPAIGRDGRDGEDGENIVAIAIDANGFWVINGVTQSFKAVGVDGSQVVVIDGVLWINGEKTDIQVHVCVTTFTLTFLLIPSDVEPYLTQVVIAGAWPREPSKAPTRAETKFEFWYLEGSFNPAPFDFDAPLTANTTLVAKWDFEAELDLSTTAPVTLEEHGDELTITYSSSAPDLNIVAEIDNNDWLDVDITATNVKISAERNYTGFPRTARLIFSSLNFPEINTRIEVTQIGTHIFFDDFSWLGIATATLPASPVNLTSTTGERTFPNWAADFGAHVWSSTPIGSNPPRLYSRYQFIKFAMGGNSADLISPKLANIVGAKDIIVSFKLNAYVGSAGNEITDFTIKVTGGGTITQILKVGKHTVTGAPCYGEVTPQGAHFVACNDWETGSALNWDPDYSERSFVVEGATSETQIHFIGDITYQVRAEPGNRRFGFDDVLIILK